MVSLSFGPRTVDLPYTVRILDVTEEQFDELVDEDTKAELLDGVMIVHSPASPRHNRIAHFLRHLLTLFAEEHDLGQVFGPDDLVRLAKGRKVAPDAFFLRQGRVPSPLPPKEFDLAPDLVIEVLSPSNRAEDLGLKRPMYRQAGVRETWLVDPDGQVVIVDRKGKGRYTSGKVTEGRIFSKALPGFFVEAEWLWAEPLPKVGICLKEILA
jgi:Uma2 family endonuclease